jgi:hypothetical protein
MNVIHRALCIIQTPEEINGAHRCPTYMYRWILGTIGPVKIYLHHFVGDDWSLDLHDHPKRFVSIGLWGRYNEARPTQTVERFNAPWFRTFPSEHRHRLMMVRPGEECWTLIFVGPPQRAWGFWHLARFVPFMEYVRGPLGDKMKACP